MGVDLEVRPGNSGRRSGKSRSTPTSLEGAGPTRHSSGGTGFELKIYETKSSENVRKHHVPYCAKVTRQMLYREALYTGTHMLGKPSTRFPSSQEDILTYVQVSFANNIQARNRLVATPLNHNQGINLMIFPLLLSGANGLHPGSNCRALPAYHSQHRDSSSRELDWTR